MHTLNEKQNSAIRWLSKKHGGGHLDKAAITEKTCLTDAEYEHLMHFLANRSCIEIIPVDDGIYASNLRVSMAIIELVRQIDHPPTKNYIEATKRWFFSKWWSIPLWLLLVLVPFGIGWVKMIQFLFEWFGFIGPPN